MTPTLEKMYRAMGQELPTIKRILELNPNHALVAGLRAAHEQRPEDEELAGTARLLHDMALLAEGGELTNPTRFVSILAQRLERTL
jgi:molecular chaperone HtpG